MVLGFESLIGNTNETKARECADRKRLSFRQGLENLEYIARSVASTIRKVYRSCKLRVPDRQEIKVPIPHDVTLGTTY